MDDRQGDGEESTIPASRASRAATRDITQDRTCCWPEGKCNASANASSCKRFADEGRQVVNQMDDGARDPINHARRLRPSRIQSGCNRRRGTFDEQSTGPRAARKEHK
jgi:hypothetical protein